MDGLAANAESRVLIPRGERREKALPFKIRSARMECPSPMPSITLGRLGISYDFVPEPSTWAMMLLGFAGLGYAGYRASRKSVAVAA